MIESAKPIHHLYKYSVSTNKYIVAISTAARTIRDSVSDEYHLLSITSWQIVIFQIFVVMLTYRSCSLALKPVLKHINKIHYQNEYLL